MQRAGDPFTVESPSGEQLVSAGHPLTLKTRRPDLAPTDNMARCKSATSSSDEPGMYAEAAVDGNTATMWAPAQAAPNATIAVDLGRTDTITHLRTHWTEQAPTSYHLEVSTDGRTWSPAPPIGPDGKLAQPVHAGHVRLNLTRDPEAGRVGLRELEAVREAAP